MKSNVSENEFQAHIFRVVEFEVKWNALIAFSFHSVQMKQAKREIKGLNYLIKCSSNRTHISKFRILL